MTGVRIKASEFRRSSCGLRFGGYAEPNAAASVFLMPLVSNVSARSISPLAAAPATGGPMR